MSSQSDLLNFYIENDGSISGTSEASKDIALSIANGRLSQTVFGAKYNNAVALLAAHILSMNSGIRSGGTGGAISTKKEGDLSISFGSNAAFDSRLDSTSYGQQLEQLKKECVFAPSINAIPGLVTGNFGNG
jgi:hypothetical protein